MHFVLIWAFFLVKYLRPKLHAVRSMQSNRNWRTNIHEHKLDLPRINKFCFCLICLFVYYVHHMLKKNNYYRMNDFSNKSLNWSNFKVLLIQRNQQVLILFNRIVKKLNNKNKNYAFQIHQLLELFLFAVTGNG